MKKLNNFVFDGVTYNVDEKVKVTRNASWDPQNPHRDYVGVLVYIISYEYTFTNREEIDFILDSNEEHSMSLRHIERVEKV